MMSASPLVRLRDVGVCYTSRSIFPSRARHWALRKVTFDLHHGETLGIVGRNGSGKSTLLRLLARIIEPDRGELTRGPERTALLSLQAGFLPHLSGRENIMLGGILLGFRHGEMLEKAGSIIEFSQLGYCIDDPLATYSQGMKARLGFALALQVDPEILLIDEILGVGDMEFRKRSSEALKERIRSDRTVVLVSHDLKTMESHCDRIAWIERGETVAVGGVPEVLREYRNSAAL